MATKKALMQNFEITGVEPGVVYVSRLKREVDLAELTDELAEEILKVEPDFPYLKRIGKAPVEPKK